MINILFPAIALIGAIYIKQENLLLFGKKLSHEWKPSLQYEYQEIFLPAHEDQKIILQHGVYFYAYNEKKRNKTKGIVIYYHGNSANVDIAQDYCLPFLESGYDVLMMDYRGFGKSQGKIKKPDHLLKDALMWFDWVKNNIEHTNIVLVGKSLGSGLATYVSSLRPSSLLMLITPYDALHSVASNKYPFLPAKFLMKYLFPASIWIQQVKAPIRMIHGNQDEVIFPIRAHTLFEIAKSAQKDVEILWLDAAKHDNLHMYYHYHKWINHCLLEAFKKNK